MKWGSGSFLPDPERMKEGQRQGIANESKGPVSSHWPVLEIPQYARFARADVWDFLDYLLFHLEKLGSLAFPEVTGCQCRKGPGWARRHQAHVTREETGAHGEDTCPKSLREQGPSLETEAKPGRYPQHNLLSVAPHPSCYTIPWV